MRERGGIYLKKGQHGTYGCRSPESQRVLHAERVFHTAAHAYILRPRTSMPTAVGHSERILVELSGMAFGSRKFLSMRRRPDPTAQ